MGIFTMNDKCHQTPNISRILVGKEIIDHSDVSALPQLRLHSLLNIWLQLGKINC